MWALRTSRVASRPGLGAGGCACTAALRRSASDRAPGHRRRSFAAVEEVTARLVARLHERGAAAALDVDGALMCHALDVIGKVTAGGNSKPRAHRLKARAGRR